MGEALDALENDHDYLTAGGVFPQRLIDIWLERKRKELQEIEQIPSPSEFKYYYDLYIDNITGGILVKIPPVIKETEVQHGEHG